MKKTILKTVVATAVVAATMVVSSVAAFAAETKWLATDETIPEVFGFGFSDASKTITFSDSRTGCFVDPIFGDTGETKNKTGIDTNKQYDVGAYTKDSDKETGIAKSFSITPTETGTIKFYVCRDGSASDNSIRIYSTTYDEASSLYKRDSDTIISAHIQSGRTETEITSIDLKVEKGKRYTVYSNNSSTVLLGATFVSDDTTVSISETKAAVGSDFYALDAKNNTTYIIHPVSEQEMAYNKLALKGNDNKNVAETDTVYTSIKFADDSELKAADFGGATAIYAVLVTGTDGKAPTATSFEWVEVK